MLCVYCGGIISSSSVRVDRFMGGGGAGSNKQRVGILSSSVDSGGGGCKIEGINVERRCYV